MALLTLAAFKLLKPVSVRVLTGFWFAIHAISMSPLVHAETIKPKQAGQNLAQAEDLAAIQAKAAKGDPQAQALLALAKINGQLAPVDLPLAYHLSQKLSRLGEPLGLFCSVSPRLMGAAQTAMVLPQNSSARWPCRD